MKIKRMGWTNAGIKAKHLETGLVAVFRKTIEFDQLQKNLIERTGVRR